MESDILTYLKSRGVVAAQTHPELDEFLANNKVTLYTGFDPTSESMHIGNLSAIITLMRFQKYGHKPIALVGGGTGLIGDPSGRDKERQLDTIEEVQRRGELIRKQLSRFLRFGDGPSDALMLNNYEWIKELSVVSFLRDIGKHFRVQDMISRESVKRRLESQEGISFTEFSYQILQSYDFLYQFLHYDCVLQAGGSDQWGNITAGTDLIREVTGKQAYGLVTHLITRSDGRKFGKSEAGTEESIWLDAERTSPFDFYQFWMGVDDRDVLGYILSFTEIEGEEFADLRHATAAMPEKRLAQRRLAFEVTKMVHGEAAATEAESRSGRIFNRLVDTEQIITPNSEISRQEIESGITIAQAFVRAKLTRSNGEAYRKAKEGAIWINDLKIDDASQKLYIKDFNNSDLCFLRFGKKKIHVLKLK